MAMATDALRWCLESFSSKVPEDDIGWQSLADVHALEDEEIEHLMRCKVVHIRDDWQVDLVASQLRSTDNDGDAVRLRRLLCMMVRAEIRERVATTALDDVTLRIALREVEHVPDPMASCVRLARVLACKLDAVSGLAQICEDVCTKE